MKLHDALLAALDPAEILRVRGLSPDPWQQGFLLSRERHILLNCSRQSGKSTTVAALALHTLLFQPGSLTLLGTGIVAFAGAVRRKLLSRVQG